MSPSNFVLYAQHGWADTNREIAKLANNLVDGDRRSDHQSDRTLVIAPNLGWFNTWLRIEPLIQNLEQIVTATIAEHPDLPIRIIGHSMGGLIWLELLSRHRHWWSLVHSLTLVASPVGGSDLGRIFDPLAWGLGIARDLGRDRRAIAEVIANHIPTLIIAGDVDNGSDGTVLIQTTQFRHAQFQLIKGVDHAQMKNHDQVAQIIRQFWQNPQIPPAKPPDLRSRLLDLLFAIPGITDAHPRDFAKAKLFARLQEGFRIKTWRNFFGVEHVFLADASNNCVFSGFVGLIHKQDLYAVLEQIVASYS